LFWHLSKGCQALNPVIAMVIEHLYLGSFRTTVKSIKEPPEGAKKKVKKTD